VEVEVCELIELSFWRVSRVGLGIRVLDGVQEPQGKGQFRGFSLPLVSMAYFLHINVIDSCVKRWQYFRTDDVSLDLAFHWLYNNTVEFEVDGGVLQEICQKMLTILLHW